jgi:hypothetical protein
MQKPAANKHAPTFHKDGSISYYSERYARGYYRQHISRIPREIAALFSAFDYQRYLHLKQFKGKKYHGTQSKAKD